MSPTCETTPLVRDHDGFPPALKTILWLTSATVIVEGYDQMAISGAIVLIKEDLHLTGADVGWILGAPFFMMAAGAAIISHFADLFGRKIALTVVYAFLATGPVCCAIANSFGEFLMGRMLLGVGVGAGISIVATYLAEIASEGVRGRLVGLQELLLATGGFLGSVGNYVLYGATGGGAWRWMLGLGALPPIVLVVFLNTPLVLESPRWLMLQGDIKGAEEACEMYVGSSEAKRFVEEWRREDTQVCAPWSEVLFPTTQLRRRSLMSGMVVGVLNAGGGIAVINNYIGTIVSSATDKRSSFLYLTAYGIMRVLAIALTLLFISDNYGRRPALLLSAAGTALSVALLAGFYATSAPVVPCVTGAILLFALAHAVGLGPAAWPYIAEVSSTDVRSRSIALIVATARVFTGTTLLVLPLLQVRFGWEGIFTLLSFLNVAGFGMMLVYVRETNGLSLEQIGKADPEIC